MVKDFFDLETWQKGHALALQIYQITKGFPNNEKFGLISQTQRAASSVTANIAEGFGRYYYKDKIRFYYQARGSIAEVQSFLLLARDLGYTDHETCRNIITLSKTVHRLINGLIRTTRHR